MKAALAGLVMIGTAGSIGAVLPSPNAPYRIGHIAVPRVDDAGISDHVMTYAASAPMTRAEVTAWAGKVAWSRSGPSLVLVYAPGLPVPDPSRATSLRDALWIAERGPLHWRVDIDAGGTREITQISGG